MPSEAPPQEPRDRGPLPPVTRAGRSAQLAKEAATSPAFERRSRGRPRKDGPPTPPPPTPTPPKARNARGPQSCSSFQSREGASRQTLFPRPDPSPEPWSWGGRGGGGPANP
ncbi:Fibrous sheath-interacting protein 2 [Dissostichus eleginoides]|uniref:Fibrous sheath-interacting protein 2 n=1 Tax=Dissostichus eleginoides TaxID=100907 RepID=A0AAD9F3U8_DISEL|nr:Fibrous sheath-interacting protein 2 [Dissostichus eleginoides]